MKQELECFQLIEIFLPAILDASCPRVPQRAAPGTGGFQFENVVPGYLSVLLERSCVGWRGEDAQVAASPSPRRGAKVTEGSEHREGTAAVPPAAPATHNPGFCFLAKKKPRISIIQTPPPRTQFLRETAPLQRSRSGIFGERQNAFGSARLGWVWGEPTV